MKLPLKEHVKLQGTSVLTVNHVFEILLKYRSTGSWTEAFSILPDRKMIILTGASEDKTDQQEESKQDIESDPTPSEQV